MGLLVGILLTTSFEFTRAALTDPRDAILTPAAIAEAAFLFSLADALVITLICVPIWLLAARLRLASPVTAAVLGFVATLMYWIFGGYPPGESLVSGLPYALFGAAAGLTIWWSSQRR